MKILVEVVRMFDYSAKDYVFTVLGLDFINLIFAKVSMPYIISIPS